MIMCIQSCFVTTIKAIDAVLVLFWILALTLESLFLSHCYIPTLKCCCCSRPVHGIYHLPYCVNIDLIPLRLPAFISAYTLSPSLFLPLSPSLFLPLSPSLFLPLSPSLFLPLSPSLFLPLSTTLPLLLSSYASLIILYLHFLLQRSNAWTDLQQWANKQRRRTPLWLCLPDIRHDRTGTLTILTLNSYFSSLGTRLY